MQPDLEIDLMNSDKIKNKISDDIYAQNLYAALCNNDWIKQEFLPMLEGCEWSASWRHSGSMVADLRNNAGGLRSEDYLDYYCSGMIQYDEENPEHQGKNYGYVSEGTITEEIKKDLKELGWVVK